MNSFQVEKHKGGEDQHTCTLDGTVDFHGHPAIQETSGRWVAGIIILGRSYTRSVLFYLSYDSFTHKLR